MGARIDSGKGMADDAVRINDVGNAAGKTSLPGTIRLAHDMIGVAQQWKGQAGSGGEGVILFDRVKTGPENLYIALRESIIEVTEPVPLGRSSPGIGFGIKPQNDLLAAEICQAHGVALVFESDRIRVLPVGEAKQFWASWWAGQPESKK